MNQSRDLSRPHDESWMYLSGVEEVHQTIGLYASVSRLTRQMLEGRYFWTRIRNRGHVSKNIVNQKKLILTLLHRF